MNDPRWEWHEVYRWGGEVEFIRGRCNHLEVELVESGGVLVARLCLTCDAQLPGDV